MKGMLRQTRLEFLAPLQARRTVNYKTWIHHSSTVCQCVCCGKKRFPRSHNWSRSQYWNVIGRATSIVICNLCCQRVTVRLILQPTLIKNSNDSFSLIERSYYRWSSVSLAGDLDHPGINWWKCAPEGSTTKTDSHKSLDVLALFNCLMQMLF